MTPHQAALEMREAASNVIRNGYLSGARGAGAEMSERASYLTAGEQWRAMLAEAAKEAT